VHEFKETGKMEKEEWVATVHFATLIFKNFEFHRKINEVSKNHIFDTSFVYSLSHVFIIKNMAFL
jgi:hypothetical protein